MLERVQAEPNVPLTVVELVLDSVATLQTSETSATPLAAAVRPLLTHAEPRVRAMAARAIGGLDSQADTETIRQMLAAMGEDPRVRRESAAALAKLRGPEAIDDLIAAATDASMEVIVVRQLTAIGSERGLPYLREIAENHYNSYLRREAARSITKIEAGPPKKRKAKSTKTKSAKKPRPARTTTETNRVRPIAGETG
jgi:HEAT repeat protein